MLQRRPNTFAQTILSFLFFACDKAADHTLPVNGPKPVKVKGARGFQARCRSLGEWEQRERLLRFCIRGDQSFELGKPVEDGAQFGRWRLRLVRFNHDEVTAVRGNVIFYSNHVDVISFEHYLRFFNAEGR